MCFDYDCGPSVYRESWPKARKEYRCSECGVPILPGDEYLYVFGIWEGEKDTFRVCAFCQWLRERIISAEMEAGCAAHESAPPLGALYMALGDGHDREIGLINMLDYHERQECIE